MARSSATTPTRISRFHGFILEGGNFRPFEPPGAVNGATAAGVNDLGVVLGNATDANHNSTSYTLSGGVYTPINSGFAGSTAQGINNAGDIVGSYSDSHSHGIGFLIHAGVTTVIQVQGADYTFANGINNLGTIVGDYTTDIGASGFLLSGGVFTTIQFPGAAVTEIYGINDSGMIVGDYSDADGNVHAFIATSVPEPSSALLAGIAFPLIVAWARWRRPGRNARPHANASSAPQSRTFPRVTPQTV